MLLSLLEAVILAASLSTDAFAASFAYGCNKTKIPPLSTLVVSAICSGVLGASLLLGRLVGVLIPSALTLGISFTLLFLLGIAKFLDSITKSLIRNHYKCNQEHLRREMRFSLFNFAFIVNLYANPIDADADLSKSISPREASALALSLSIDGLAVGFGAALADISAPMVFLSSLLINLLTVWLGSFLGNRLACKTSVNLSWVSGAVLIGLAIFRVANG